MEGYKSKAGNGLLEICMGKNYQDSMVVYREYVQNACDAIYEAEKLGYYRSKSEMSIAIEIKPHIKEISFMDRGIGVEKNNIGERLVDIGASIKNGIDQIGSYGIGRLVGANWCEKIVFETSAKGENVKSVLTFDSKKAHELIKDKTADCTESLDAVTSCKYEDEDNDAHYFRVTLVNAKETLYQDTKQVESYLSSMVPVDYSYEFEDLINPSLEGRYPEYKELIQQLIRCNITVNGKPIEKPYSNVIYPENSSEPKKITPPSFFKIEDSTFGLLAWGWYAFNEKIEQMNSLPYRGIRLRKHNMAIGGYDYLDTLFPRKVDASYFIGEIHIVHPEIQPTGTREAVETSASPVARVFLYKLQNQIFPILKRDYESLSRSGSSGYTPIINSLIKMEATKESLKMGVAPNVAAAKQSISEEKTNIENAIKALRTKTATLHGSTTTSPDVAEFLLAQAEKKLSSEVKKFNEKNTTIQISAPTIETIIIGKTIENSASTTNEGHTSTKKVKDVAQNSTNPEVYKALGKIEYKLMKQVYQVLDGTKTLPPQTLEEIKQKLAKKLLVK